MDKRSKILVEKSQLLSSFDPLCRKLKNSNDWVEDLKIILSYMGEAFENFSKPLLSEGLKDDFVNETGDKVYEFIISFQKSMYRFSKILDKQYKPLPLATKKKIDIEMQMFWDRLQDSLDKAKGQAKQIKSKAIMLDIWDSEEFSDIKKFIEHLLETNLSDIKTRMTKENPEFPLGDDVVSVDED